MLLNGATDITATDAATVLQAGIIEAATNDGTNTYNITDTPTNLAASTNEVLSLAGTVTASVPATAHAGGHHRWFRQARGLQRVRHGG